MTDDEVPETPDEPVDLGDVQIPEGEQATQALRELAEVNDRAISAQKVYLEQAAKTKRAREKYQGLAEEVQTLLRRFTHGPELPLFDAAEREDDQQAMEAAAEAVVIASDLVALETVLDHEHEDEPAEA